MKTTRSVTNSIMAALGLLSTLFPISQTAHAQDNLPGDFVAPTVFQAAGPTAASIQGTVDAYRAALGDPNNANNPGPLLSGRREINWDGGNPAIMDTTPPVTPFDVFLNIRGARFTTPGEGLSQAPPSGGPQGGLAVLFNNPTTPPSSPRSAHPGCSLRWGAGLPTVRSSSLGPAGLRQRRSVASA